MIGTIARRELVSLFLSPLAWVILAILQFILAFLFLGHVDLYLRAQPSLLTLPNGPGVTEIVAQPLLGNTAVILLLIVPLLSMRLISDERRQRTITLLFSAPVSMTEIAVGKYLGLLTFLLLLTAMVVLMPLSLLVGGRLDWGMFLAGLVGLCLLLSTFAAIGLFMSALSPNPTIAGAATFGALFLLWIAAWSSGGGGAMDHLLRYLSLVDHYEPFLRGEVRTSDIAYFLVLTTAFLSFTVRRLDAGRLGG